MKRIIAVFLILLLMVPSALAGEEPTAQYGIALRELLHDEMGMPRDRELKVYKVYYEETMKKMKIENQ